MMQEQYYSREELLHKYESEPDFVPYAETIPLCGKMFTDELNCALSQYKGGFVNYQAVTSLEVACLWPLIDRLKAFYERKPDEARNAAQNMIDILKVTETDDDMFPINIIQDIREAVGHKYDETKDLPIWI